MGKPAHTEAEHECTVTLRFKTYGSQTQATNAITRMTRLLSIELGREVELQFVDVVEMVSDPELNAMLDAIAPTEAVD